MAQDPLQVDALQINGDTSTGVRQIAAVDSSGNPEDGAMLLSDAQVPAGIKLADLAGLQQVGNVYLVGLSGLGVSKTSDGTSFNTIQEALDAITIAKTADDPALVLVAPGLYTENLTVEKDGIEIRGLGRVVIRNSGDANTITVTSGLGTPLGLRLRDVRVENTQDARACVLLDGGIGSTIGSEAIELIYCDLVATGIGGFQIDADTVNNVRVVGGNWEGSSSTSICRVLQCARLEVEGVTNANRFLLGYDSAGDIPSVVGSAYSLRGVQMDDTFVCDLDGAGSLEVRDSLLGGTTLNGDRTVRMRNTETGTLTLNDTVAVTFIGGTHGTLSGAVGSSMAEERIADELVYAASTSESYAFAAPQPDVDYDIQIEVENVPAAATDLPAPQNKTTTGFDIDFGAAQTQTVRFTVTRVLT